MLCATPLCDAPYQAHFNASQTRIFCKQQASGEDPQQPELFPSNIMFDRRVVRGNTYAARVLPAEPAILGSGSSGGKGVSTG
jgi:hypothetical protein